MDETSNVQVAVRVRPFNQREIEREAVRVVSMSGNSTTIVDPETKKQHTFTFDHSYWSFDAADENFATQVQVFEDLGLQVIENAWEGYNCCIFAYGQTGSGKSYSMLGYGEDRGIIPRLCEALFKKMDAIEDENYLFKIEVSFMEIYNEKIKDLLNPKNKGSLKVRNHAKIGPYVEDLSKIAVKSYAQIEALMDEGTKARTVASTNMNATSSRSHAVFTLEFTSSRIINVDEMKSVDKVSKINLVDLAGSERASATGAEGARLKEGANINKSLSTLGKVIASLAANSSSPAKLKHVPYRDSALTWLLKESLGGNAKTIMIAAISPADINYSETLSTLRYADNAKQIKNKAVVNEDPTSKLIRDLKAEVEQLRSRLVNSDPTQVAQRDAKVNLLEEELKQREKLIAEMNKTWEERLKDADKLQAERKAALADMGVAIQAVSTVPHLVNLNEDPLMSESLLYYINQGVSKLGRSGAATHNDIQLNGLSIAAEHCTIENNNGVVTIKPTTGPNGDVPAVYVNGEKITEPRRLQQGDRVILGNNHIFRFNHPEEARNMARNKKGGDNQSTSAIDWSFAVRELAAAQKAQMTLDDRTIALMQGPSKEEEERKILEDRMLDAVLMINEANALSQSELSVYKDTTFDLKMESNVLRTTSSKNLKDLQADQGLGAIELKVRMSNKETKVTTLLSIDSFMEKLWDMRDAYQNLLEYGSTAHEELDASTFEMEVNEQLIGASYMYLKGLKYLLECNRKLPIFDQDGSAIGTLNVKIIPSFSLTNASNEIKEAKQLLGLNQKLKFEIKIQEATALSTKNFSPIYCKYSLLDTEYSTEPCDENVNFNYTNTVTAELNEDLLQFLESHALVIEVWGKPTKLYVSDGKENLDIFSSINIDEEEEETHEFVPTPIKEIHTKRSSADEKNKESDHVASVFLVRMGRKRKIRLTLLKCAETGVFFDSCTQAVMGNIKIKKSKFINQADPDEAIAIDETTQGRFRRNTVLAATPPGRTRANSNAANTPPLLNPETPEMPTQRQRGGSSSHPPPPMVTPPEHGRHRSTTPPTPEFMSPGSEPSHRRTPSVPIEEPADDSSQSDNPQRRGRSRTGTLRGNRTPAAPSTTSVPQTVSLEVEQCDMNSVVIKWDPADFSSPLLNEKTRKGCVLVVTLQLSLRFINFQQPVVITLPIHLKVVDIPSSDFATPTLLLEKYRTLLKGETETGSLFAVKVKKSVEEVGSVTDMIEEHQEKVLNLSNSIEEERLKQEIALAEKLPAIDKEKAAEQLHTLQVAAQAKRSSSVSTIASEITSDSLYRDVGGTFGYLKKKSLVSDKWTRFYFRLSRSHLYYSTTKEAMDEKVIDLTNSAVTAVQDPEKPYTFAIATWKRVYLLQASSQEEMEKWTKALDPSLNISQAHEMRKLQDTVNSQAIEIKKLTAEVNQKKETLEGRVKKLTDFCNNLKERFKILKDKLLYEQEQNKKKEKEIQKLMSSNADKPVKKVRIVEPVVQDDEILRNVVKKDTYNFDEFMTALNEREAENRELREQIEILQSQLAGKPIDISNRTTEQSQTTAQPAATANGSPVAETNKSKPTSNLAASIKNIDKVVKSSRETSPPTSNAGTEGKSNPSASLDRTNDNVPQSTMVDNNGNDEENTEPAQKEDNLEALLRDMGINPVGDAPSKENVVFTNRTVPSEPSPISFLGSNDLEEQLRMLSQVVETQTTAKVGEKEEPSHVQLLFEELRKRYFFAVAVSVKMQLITVGFTCNVDVNALWEEALALDIKDFKVYEEWVNEKMFANAQAFPEFDLPMP